MDSHREGVERMSQKTGLPFATLDYAGHGLHALPIDESTRQQQHEEVVAVYDELKDRGYENIIVIGGSFGSYMAALLVGARPVHTVVLRAPAIYDDTEFELSFNKTLRWLDHDAYQKNKETAAYIQNNAAVRAIRAFEGTTYVFEHELDEVIPAVMPQTYYKAAKHGNYIVIPKTKHSPKYMPNPQPHFDYIEHWVVSVLEAVKLQANLT